MTANPARTTLVVGISDMAVSRDGSAVITTHSLGSCVGVTVYDPLSGAGGMLHCQLPDSHANANRDSKAAATFADTGVAALIEAVARLGCVADRRRLVVTACGGASMFDGAKGGRPAADAAVSTLQVGKRNVAAVRKALWQAGLLLVGQDFGGHAPRNMSLRLRDGAVAVRTNGTVIALNRPREAA